MAAADRTGAAGPLTAAIARAPAGATRRLVGLQVLRAAAALLVVASHALAYPIRRGLLTDDWYRIAWLFGWIGVGLFFVVSGFIMLRTGGGDFGRPGAARRFLARRIVRVVPLYWLATLPFAAAALARGEPVTGGMVIQSLLFIPYPSPVEPAMRPIVGQGWTLNCEMLFYLVFALCLPLPRRWGLLMLAAILPALVLAGRVVAGDGAYRDPLTRFAFWTDPVMLLFAAGLALAWILRPGAGRALPFASGWAGLAVMVPAAAFVASGAAFPLPLWWQAMLGLGCVAAVGCCIAGAPRPDLAKVHPFEKAGDASYSIYLSHPLVLMVLAAGWDRLPLALRSPAGFVALALIVCTLAGLVAFRLIEAPLTRWLNRRLLGLGARPVLAADRPAV